MFVRMAAFKGDMERMDEGVSIFSEKILPETETQPGFAGAMLLVDRDGGVAYSLTFWDSEEALEARRERANEWSSSVARDFRLELDVSKCEVAVARFPAATTG